MKPLIIFLVLLSPLVSTSQVTPEIEQALYKVNVEGESAFYTDLYCSSASSFERDQFETVKQIAMAKEGVFDVRIVEDGRIIRIAHLSFVEPEAMKYFGTTVCDAIEVEPRQPYSF
ncbi:MAG: hypothetical protein P8P74_17980 [Crocinitomicaceae bacterium]|nr:hypothetical protein [Crocinitomicaceae bacterium]